MDAPDAQVQLDDLLTALGAVQRRKLLDSLIADSSRDGAKPGITVANDIPMHHNHLPKLADCGLINWDRKTNRVTKGPNFKAAAEILEFLANNDKRSPTPEVEV